MQAEKQEKTNRSSCGGFSFIEVVVAMAVTVVVLGSVFALLTLGLGSTPRETQRSDLQAQARHALEMVGRDVFLAGTNMPPEYPVFTPPDVNPELQGLSEAGQAIEIVGDFSGSASHSEPVPVMSFDGQTAVLEFAATHIKQGDLVLLYDDKPTDGKWTLGLVSSVNWGFPPYLTVKTLPGDQEGDLTLPPFIQNYNRAFPTSGFLTPVTVIAYTMGPDDPAPRGKPEQVLWKQINWQKATQVAYVEDFQIRYYIGGTIDEISTPSSDVFGQHLGRKTRWPKELPVPPGTPGGPGNDSTAPSGSNPPTEPETGVGWEYELFSPPIPQPDPLSPVNTSRLVRGVRISVTTRSHQANLQGSTVRPDQTTDEDAYLRMTLSSRAATRNLLLRMSARSNFQAFN